MTDIIQSKEIKELKDKLTKREELFKYTTNLNLLYPAKELDTLKVKDDIEYLIKKSFNLNVELKDSYLDTIKDPTLMSNIFFKEKKSIYFKNIKFFYTKRFDKFLIKNHPLLSYNQKQLY